MFNINLKANIPYPKVPNQLPTTSAPYSIAFIGEAPAKDEVEQNLPFVGPAGHLLTSTMAAVGILRSACYIGNLTPYQPPNNKYSNFKTNGPEISEGLRTLTADLQNLKPNLVVLLGQNPLQAAGIDHKISSFRGTLFKCLDPTSPFFSLKCLATFHPSYINQSGYNDKPLFIADFRRAFEEGHTSVLDLPQYDFNLRPSTDWLISELESLSNNSGHPIAIDIEGMHPTISCISICKNPRTGFIIPFNELSPSTLPLILRKLAALLQNPSIPKILQNGLFDASNLALSFNILVNPIADDTMLSAWELQPELRKSLGLLASLYTKQPFYKEDRKTESRDTFFNYCCTDSAVTYEIRNVHRELLTKEQNAHYQFNLQLLRPLLYCQIRGINYDVDGAKDFRSEFLIRRDEIGNRISARASTYGLTSINPASPKQLVELLYHKIGFPPQYQKTGNRYDTSKPTTGEDALLDLYQRFDDSIITDILAWRSNDKRRQYSEIKHDPDLRIRSSYNLVGAVTGRISSSKTASGTGYNLQTIPKKLRTLFRADPDYHFFQCDLSGADGWTVAAYSAALGDPTMLEDYQAGIKPAKVIALMYHHGPDVNSWSREKILEASQSINEEGDGWWLYFACKRIQHATSYDAKPAKIVETITKDAYKKEGQLLTIPKHKCQELQDLYERVRYRGVLSFKNFIRQKLNTTHGYPTLTDSSGHTRTFFGRPRDSSTYREALSHLPQSNTTYVTNLAMHRLWHDPENRRPDGSLIIEPLHQVHDAICGQFPISSTSWAISKIRSYFQNPITIDSITLTIPFDGAYGPSWGDLSAGRI